MCSASGKNREIRHILKFQFSVKIAVKFPNDHWYGMCCVRVGNFTKWV